LLYALARFGRWDEILAQPASPADLPYSTAIWHYARGLAFAYKGSHAEAIQEQELLRQERRQIPARKVVGVNRASDFLRIAYGILDAKIAEDSGDSRRAYQSLTDAVSAQDNLKYDEPPPWYYPVRESLGALLLRMGRPADAASVYRADLRRNPNSGWSLNGLVNSLSAQHKVAEMDVAQERFLMAWKYADFTPGEFGGELARH